MNLLIVVSSLLVVSTFGTPTNRINDGVCYQGKYYEEVLLKTGLEGPFLLAVDHETDTLYFNYELKREYKSARLNLKTNELKDIDGIPNGFSHAVDSEHHLLYVGTTDGIFVYNNNTDQSEFYGAKGKLIWTLFFKDDVLYFSEYPSQDFYVYSNGIPKKFKELEHTKVHFFVLDNDNNIFFSNDTGLYKQVRGTKNAVLYKSFRTYWVIRSLTVDLFGNVYAGLGDGIYLVSKDEVKMEKVLDVFDLFGLTFDRENKVIYSDASGVMRLRYNC